MSQPSSKFEHWCIVELFGHSKIAGKCTEENIAGSNMLRVDVPETTSQPAYTKYYGSAAIYAINPVDMDTAKICAESLNIGPVAAWQAKDFSEKYQEKVKALPPVDNDEDNEDDDFFNPDF